jgi:hypothetical protein
MHRYAARFHIKIQKKILFQKKISKKISKNFKKNFKKKIHFFFNILKKFCEFFGYIYLPQTIWWPIGFRIPGLNNLGYMLPSPLKKKSNFY